ncbi:MAG: hypothetical protein JF606_29435, partial [Burkholderiales bacterium]|nr:hypothetical protein [Burkholderiales bacterium]
WLDEQAQSGAAVGLPAEQLQQLALLLGRMRDHLQDLPAQAVQVSASSSSPMRPLQEHELDDFIHEMSQQIEPVRAGRRRAQASDATVQDIASRYPQEDRESKTAWAKRIHAGEAPLRARPFEERLAVLQAVTGARASNLRSEPVLQDVDPNLESLARVIKARMPQAVVDGPAAYALRIYKEDGDVRALPEAARIAVLAIVTGARESSLRRMPELRDIPASKISLVEGIRSQVPQLDGEKRGAWARRIHREDKQVQALPFPERITALALVTGMREDDLRCIPSLQDPGPLERQAEAVRQSTPRGDGESGLGWARRIYKNDFSVRRQPYVDRIALLAVVTDVQEKDLRQDSTLKDPPGGGLPHFVSRTLGGSSVSRHSTLDSPSFGGLAPIMDDLPTPSHSRGTYPSAQGQEPFTRSGGIPSQFSGRSHARSGSSSHQPKPQDDPISLLRFAQPAQRVHGFVGAPPPPGASERSIPASSVFRGLPTPGASVVLPEESHASSTRAAATSPDLSSLRSEIPEDSFRTVAEGLSLTNHINN